MFDVELGIVFERLLIKGVQNGMSRSIGSRAGSLCRAFTEVCGHATKWSLVDFAIISA